MKKNNRFYEYKEKKSGFFYNCVPKILICAKCGNEFETIYVWRAKNCFNCRENNNQKYNYVKKDPKDYLYREKQVCLYPENRTLKCKTCHKDYETRARHSKYCSDDCKKGFVKKIYKMTERFEKDQ